MTIDIELFEQYMSRMSCLGNYSLKLSGNCLYCVSMLSLEVQRTMLVKYIILAGFAICLTQVKAAEKSNDIKNIDRLMLESHKRGLFNGNILVSQNGKILYQNEIGFTSGDKKARLTKSAAFSLGSISKEFSAVGIMLLQQQGLVNIEHPLSRYELELPSWSKAIKIKHLLNYTSGLPKLNFRKVKHANDIKKQLDEIESLQFLPGEGYLYSNLNILLQIKLIEKITQKPYENFVEEHFFNALHMNDSFLGQKNKSTTLVSSFNNDGVDDPHRPFPIALAVHSTAADMLKWITALHSEQLISKVSLNQLFKAFNTYSNSALGNAQYNGDKLMRHRHHGSHFNFESQVSYNAELGLSIILLTNNKNFKLSSINDAIEAIIQGKLFKLPKKSIYLEIRQAVYEDIDKGIERYNSLKQSEPNLYDFENKSALIRIGYKLIEQKQLKSAIRIFELAVKEFPNDANAFDSLAEGFFLNGQLKLALKNYNTSVHLNPKNTNGFKMIEKIESVLGKKEHF